MTHFSDFWCIGTLLWLAMAPSGAIAQPTVLFDCFGDGADLTSCSDVADQTLFDTSCPEETAETFLGRVAWNPLRYEGPVELEVKARSIGPVRFPIVFEVIPLFGRDPLLGFCDGPGIVIAVAHGQDHCAPSETFGPLFLDISGVPLGTEYVLRASFVGSSGNNAVHSAFLWCVAMRRSTEAMERIPWGRVKELYR